jgi:hypothetical protein
MNPLERLEALEDQTLTYLDNLQALLDYSASEILQEQHESSMKAKLQACLAFLQLSSEELHSLIAALPPARTFRFDKPI